MRILHISTFDYGGAGLATLRLHKSMLKQGYSSKMLVAKKISQLDTIHVAKENFNFYNWSSIWLFRKFQKHILRRFGYITKIEKIQKKIDAIPSENRVFFSSPVTHYNLLENQLVQEADIIHLHWIADFIDFETFFKSINKPIVWTLHDENIGLGGFHYSEVFLKNAKYYKNIENEFCEIKKHSLSSNTNISLIALSKVMGDFCSNYSFLKQLPRYIIHNGIDYNVYRPLNKNFARSVFNISSNELVLAFCSVDIHEERKGLKDLMQALEILSIPNLTLLCIGNGEVQNTSINTVCVGGCDNENMMALLYSSADLLVTPSTQESFGQTTIEAMLCGIPVVAYPSGIAPEIINDTNGVLCSEFTVHSLMKSIRKGLQMSFNSESIRENIVNQFSSDKIAGKYISVYNDVLKLCQK